MRDNTSANIYIVAPHSVQAEIQRLFKMPIDQMRAELGGDAAAPNSGQYLRPELCIDHIKLYYINGDKQGSWRYDIALVSKRFPDAKIYYREMHDDGRAGADTNDAEKQFFMPYGVMVENYPMRRVHDGVDVAELRRACSEIWTKQNDGFDTLEEAQRFVDGMHRTFPNLAKWIEYGDISLWINHFVLEHFDADAEIAKAKD